MKLSFQRQKKNVCVHVQGGEGRGREGRGGEGRGGKVKTHSLLPKKEGLQA